jgi:hypothetical protein
MRRAVPRASERESLTCFDTFLRHFGGVNRSCRVRPSFSCAADYGELASTMSTSFAKFELASESMKFPILRHCQAAPPVVWMQASQSYKRPRQVGCKIQTLRDHSAPGGIFHELSSWLFVVMHQWASDKPEHETICPCWFGHFAYSPTDSATQVSPRAFTLPQPQAHETGDHTCARRGALP